MKPRRFFYHYSKPATLQHGAPRLSVHFLDRCHIVRAIKCLVPGESKVNKRQPRVVMQGWAREVELAGEAAIIT